MSEIYRGFNNEKFHSAKKTCFDCVKGRKVTFWSDAEDKRRENELEKQADPQGYLEELGKDL